MFEGFPLSGVPLYAEVAYRLDVHYAKFYQKVCGHTIGVHCAVNMPAHILQCYSEVQCSGMGRETADVTTSGMTL